MHANSSWCTTAATSGARSAAESRCKPAKVSQRARAFVYKLNCLTYLVALIYYSIYYYYYSIFSLYL